MFTSPSSGKTYRVKPKFLHVFVADMLGWQPASQEDRRRAHSILIPSP